MEDHTLQSMDSGPASLVVKVTCGTEALERLNQGFTVAATALAAGVEVSLWLTGDATRTDAPRSCRGASSCRMPCRSPSCGTRSSTAHGSPSAGSARRAAGITEDDLAARRRSSGVPPPSWRRSWHRAPAPSSTDAVPRRGMHRLAAGARGPRSTALSRRCPARARRRPHPGTSRPAAAEDSWPRTDAMAGRTLSIRRVAWETAAAQEADEGRGRQVGRPQHGRRDHRAHATEQHRERQHPRAHPGGARGQVGEGAETRDRGETGDGDLARAVAAGERHPRGPQRDDGDAERRHGDGLGEPRPPVATHHLVAEHHGEADDQRDRARGAGRAPPRAGPPRQGRAPPRRRSPARTRTGSRSRAAPASPRRRRSRPRRGRRRAAPGRRAGPGRAERPGRRWRPRRRGRRTVASAGSTGSGGRPRDEPGVRPGSREGTALRRSGASRGHVGPLVLHARHPPIIRRRREAGPRPPHPRARGRRQLLARPSTSTEQTGRTGPSAGREAAS